MPTSFEKEEYFIYSNFKLIRSVLKNFYQKTKDESIVKDEKKIAKEVLEIVDTLKYKMEKI